jgi:hypothetical protein
VSVCARERELAGNAGRGQGDGRQAGHCERNGEIEADTTDYASRLIAKQGKCVANAEAEKKGLGSTYKYTTHTTHTRIPAATYRLVVAPRRRHARSW